MFGDASTLRYEGLSNDINARQRRPNDGRAVGRQIITKKLAKTLVSLLWSAFGDSNPGPTD